jgi:hypothetical protein
MKNGVTTQSVTIIVGFITAILAGGLITSVVGYYGNQRARRRKIIAEAVKVAFERVEILYKIRRRTNNPDLLPSDELAIRNEMHDIQSKTDYFITIISSESAWLGVKYQNLISEIKRQTEPLLQEAWERVPQGIGVKLKQDKHPNLSKVQNSFILDSQRYFNPMRRLWFASLFRIHRANK